MQHILRAVADVVGIENVSRIAGRKRRILQLYRHATKSTLYYFLATSMAISITPAIMAIYFNNFVDTISVLFSGGLERSTEALVFSGATIFAVLLIANEVLVGLQAALARKLSAEIDGDLRKDVRMFAAHSFDYECVESSWFQSRAARVCSLNSGSRGRSAGASFGGQVILIFRFVGAIFAAVVLAWWTWVGALVLFVGSLAIRIIVRRQWMHLASVADRSFDSERAADDLARLIIDPKVSREFRIFSVYDWFVSRWHSVSIEASREHLSEHSKVLFKQKATLLISCIVVGAALLSVGQLLSDDRLSVAAAGGCLVAIMSVYSISFMGREALDIDYGQSAVDAYFEIRSHKEESLVRVEPADLVSDRTVVSLDSVRFMYRGSDQYTIDDVSLEIRRGEKLAIVGRNGAGKSTLIKLILGHVAPTSGLVRYHSDIFPHSEQPRKLRTAFLTQEFTNYPLTLRENVSIGGLVDAPGDDSLIYACLNDVGLYPELERSGLKLDTLLGDPGTGGRSLSGGQWQRLTLARILYSARCGAQLVVLDEPLSQQDVLSEVRLNSQILEILSECTVVFVSHRLSTARFADRIIVVDDGRIREQGTHESLMNYSGIYYELFSVQADSFRDRVRFRLEGAE